jgi:cytochrome c oxidase subunit IV
MSTATDPNPPSTAEVEEHAHDHPSDWLYVKIAVILGVITAVEVATYFTEHSTFISVSLILMMIAKFIIVAGYFMHLKYDNPLFKRVFVFGLLLAVAVFLVMLFAFEYFDEDALKFLRP